MDPDTQSLPVEWQDVRERAAAEAPLVWMLGPAGAGQTSLLAQMTKGWRAVIRHELAPATPTAELLAYPAELPRLRFLLTTGLEPGVAYDPAADLAFVEDGLALLLVTVRAGDLELGPLIAVLRRIREAHPDWPILVAQTRLHELYPEGLPHPQPYAYDEGGAPRASVPEALAHSLMRQRALFWGLGGQLPRFVPLDLTQPEQGQEVLDYGAAALWQAIDILAPEVVRRLAPDADPEHRIRVQVVLPWAAAAAAVDAPPLPVLGGLPAIALQAAMVRAIARRFGVTSDDSVWATFLGVLGTGFVLRYAAGWAARQGLKLAPVAGGAVVAAWTFAVTCGIGEAAIRFCRDTAEGREASPEAVREAYRLGHERGSAMHGAGQGGAPY